jgi:hypothetical protein
MEMNQMNRIESYALSLELILSILAAFAGSGAKTPNPIPAPATAAVPILLKKSLRESASADDDDDIWSEVEVIRVRSISPKVKPDADWHIMATAAAKLNDLIIITCSFVVPVDNMYQLKFLLCVLVFTLHTHHTSYLQSPGQETPSSAEKLKADVQIG